LSIDHYLYAALNSKMVGFGMSFKGAWSTRSNVRGSEYLLQEGKKLS